MAYEYDHIIANSNLQCTVCSCYKKIDILLTELKHFKMCECFTFCATQVCGPIVGSSNCIKSYNFDYKSASNG